ncbi:hybrid sensor histidine kinase/response regulator [Actinoplanes subtropicus]|uniref:hybrid sensor histidine kinase/response regulator n=1 Tax=Actinoplanes subtropicus TaxID=543632 RepID=UPI00068DA188|nr:response regulator [Actinoplanes subtropicus]
MPRTAHLLLLEDSPDDAFFIIRRLRHDGLEVTFERVETIEAMRQQLRDRPPDLVISDGHMPALEVVDALDLLRSTGLDIPLILVSGQIGEEAAAALMRAGARDFVLKDNLSRLVPAVCRELDEAHDRRHRREIQAALDVMEERYRLVAEHLQDVVFRLRLRPEPEVEYISPAVTTLIGATPEELARDPELLLTAADPQDREQFLASWYSDSPQRNVLHWHRPGGDDAWVEQRTIPAYGDDHRQVGVEGILRDVTEQVRGENERRDLQHQLHQAERLDSLGQLSGGIAHDFNNILGVIKGFADLVLDALPADHECRDDIEGIERAAMQGTALTRQLLIFSRSQPSQPEVLDLNEVLTHSLTLLRRTIGEDITFAVELEPDLPFVAIDRSRLEQIIMNTVVNSRAAMPDGGSITVNTSTRPAGEDPAYPELSRGEHIRLFVEDTGHGMPPEVVQHAFEPFFSTKGPGKGTGLGLSTVYGVAKEANGAVDLWSEPGRGTRLTIYLPTCARQQKTVDTLDEPDRPPPATRIVVVDDNDDIARVASRVLSNAGYETTVTTTRLDALAVLSQSPVALVLADIVMPGMSLRDFVTAIHDTATGTRILLMSGYPAHLHKEIDTDPADLPVIAKPFDSTRLLHDIDACLRPHRTTDPQMHLRAESAR